jgi:polysaccharide biosynthesis protein PslF
VRATPSPRLFGILSTFPPTPCGIATFSAALTSGLVATGAGVDVVRCGVGPSLEDASVVAALDDGPAAAVAALDRTEVVIVQHEYGLYGGPDGDEVLGVLGALTTPAIVVAHTVLASPTTGQRAVLRAVCEAAAAVVVMTDTARARLVDDFGVDPAKVEVIAHGAATPPPDEATDEGSTGPHRLLTWGLLGPGKGIEWAIDAVASLRDLRRRPTYVIAGATHPKVLAHAGEAYREMLVRRSWKTGAAANVVFDDQYRDLESLTALIRSADVVVLPYDSKDQVTSGVLVDAVAAGRPVVSTAFPHAVELLASGAGIVVPQRDPAALAGAIRAVLTEPGVAQSMAAEARRLAPSLSWGAVASRYGDLADRLLQPAPA